MARGLVTKSNSRAVKDVVIEYWRQYKKRPWLTIAAFVLPSIGSLLIFFVPPLIIGRLINIFAARGIISFSGTIPYIVLFGVSWLLGEVLWRFGYFYINKMKSSAALSLSQIAFKRLAEQDYAFYADNFSGSVVKKTISFSFNIYSLTDVLNYNVVGNVFQIIFATIVLSTYSGWLPTILVFSIILAIIVAVPLIKRRAKYVIARNEASSRNTAQLSDAITNMITVKSFAREEAEQQAFMKTVGAFVEAGNKAFNYQNTHLDVVLSPIYVITNVIGLCCAIFFSAQYGFAAGTIVVIFSYYSQVSRIFWEINNTYRSIESLITDSAEFTELTQNPPNVQNISEAKSLQLQDTSITFKDVLFGYDGADQAFLRDFNLSIKPGERVGLVGPSGGGKTTITKLLLRFIDGQEGIISIGTTDIRTITQQSLRESISYVPQEPLLFHRSLYENIAYGKSNPTKEEVIAAAKLAHADEFITSLPKGYDTLVGERGIKLSGGQRQRVAIARAILKNAPLLVLDEATSALDSESEKYIQEGLLELMKGKTTVVIAHRLSTIKHLDRIIVLDNGKIVQDGTHDDLIKKRGIYAKLWSHQSGEFLEE